jgi:hypothetical protein
LTHWHYPLVQIEDNIIGYRFLARKKTGADQLSWRRTRTEEGGKDGGDNQRRWHSIMFVGGSQHHRRRKLAGIARSRDQLKVKRKKLLGSKVGGLSAAAAFLSHSRGGRMVAEV